VDVPPPPHSLQGTFLLVPGPHGTTTVRLVAAMDVAAEAVPRVRSIEIQTKSAIGAAGAPPRARAKRAQRRARATQRPTTTTARAKRAGRAGERACDLLLLRSLRSRAIAPFACARFAGGDRASAASAKES
jgi:hypothetical protein